MPEAGPLLGDFSQPRRNADRTQGLLQNLSKENSQSCTDKFSCKSKMRCEEITIQDLRGQEVL